MIEMALFGAGRIGKIHAGNVVRQPAARLKYVVDVNAEAARSLAQTHGATVGDVDGALRDRNMNVGRCRDDHGVVLLRKRRVEIVVCLSDIVSARNFVSAFCVRFAD